MYEFFESHTLIIVPVLCLTYFIIIIPSYIIPLWKLRDSGIIKKLDMHFGSDADYNFEDIVTLLNSYLQNELNTAEAINYLYGYQKFLDNQSTKNSNRYLCVSKWSARNQNTKANILKSKRCKVEKLIKTAKSIPYYKLKEKDRNLLSELLDCEDKSLRKTKLESLSEKIVEKDEIIFKYNTRASISRKIEVLSIIAALVSLIYAVLS